MHLFIRCAVHSMPETVRSSPAVRVYPPPFPREPSPNSVRLLRLEQRCGCRHDARLLVRTCDFFSPLHLALVHVPLPGTTHLRTYKHGQAANKQRMTDLNHAGFTRTGGRAGQKQTHAHLHSRTLHVHARVIAHSCTDTLSAVTLTSP
jgi:hypothetical protein